MSEGYTEVCVLFLQLFCSSKIIFKKWSAIIVLWVTEFLFLDHGWNIDLSSVEKGTVFLVTGKVFAF